MSQTEDKIERLEAENEELRERLDRLETALVSEEEGDEEGNITPELSRRGALTALAGAGVIGVGASGAASAEEHEEFEDAFIGENVYTAEDGTQGPFTFAVVNGGDDRNGDEFGDAHAVLGVTRSAEGVAFAGEATSPEGETRGLEGRCQSPEGEGLFGTNASGGDGSGPGIRGRTSTTQGAGVVGVNNNAEAGSDAVGVWGEVESDDGFGIATPNDCHIGGHARIDGDVDVDGTVDADGDLEITGTKHFVQAVESPSGPKKVRYTSVEAGRPRTETTDVVEMDGGRAEIDLPEHFGMVTSEEEPLSIQVTPYADEEVNPQVVEQSTDRIVVEDFSETEHDYTFAYTVKGVREGFEDKEVILEDE